MRGLLKWSNVRDVLTGATDIYADDPTRQYDQESSDGAIQLYILKNIQNCVESLTEVYKWFPYFSREYEKE